MLFIKGLLIGGTVAFPVGPIGILCLQRLLVQGPAIDLASGLGGATADIMYASLAAVGLSVLSQVIQAYQVVMRLMSSLFLIALGLYLALSQPRVPASSLNIKGLARAYFSTLFLTLANPLLILSFIAFFSLFAINMTSLTMYNLVSLLGGIFVGSTSWWVMLAGTTKKFRLLVRPDSVSFINRLSGILIIIIALISLFYMSIC